MTGRTRRGLAVVGALLLATAAAAAPPAPAAKDGAGSGVVILVRHAERADDTDDAPLSAEGKTRAERLATMLASAGVKVIFTTDFRRTRDTATPLATKLSLEPVVENDSNAVVRKIKERPGGTALVVGHSDSIPDIVAGLGGPAVEIADGDFDDLFVFVPAAKTLTRLKY